MDSLFAGKNGRQTGEKKKFYCFVLFCWETPRKTGALKQCSLLLSFFSTLIRTFYFLQSFFCFLFFLEFFSFFILLVSYCGFFLHFSRSVGTLGVSLEMFLFLWVSVLKCSFFYCLPFINRLRTVFNCFVVLVLFCPGNDRIS